jgi:hypothetical protein
MPDLQAAVDAKPGLYVAGGLILAFKRIAGE